MAQAAKNLHVMQETGVQLLSQEDPLEKEWLPTPGFLPGESHGQRSLEGYSPWSCRVTPGRGIWPRDVLKEVSRGLSRVEAGNPGFPRLVQVTSGGFSWWL